MRLRQAKLPLKRLRKHPLFMELCSSSRDARLFRKAAQITNLSLKYQLPPMHQVRAEAEAGGLMSYGPSLELRCT